MMNYKRPAGYALWVLFGINLMNFYDRLIVAAVTEPIRREWGLSDTAMGWLGTAFTLVYAAGGIPLGRLADRWTRTRLLSIVAVVWSLFTVVSAWAWNYWSFFFMRLGVGIGEAGCAPAANSLIGDLYPADKRARALSVFMLGLPLAIILTYALSGMIAQHYGWRAAFYVAALPGLILAALMWFVPEPPRGATKSDSAAGIRRSGSPYRVVLSIPTMWWVIASGALFNFIMAAVTLFLPSLLSRYHGLDLKGSNQAASMILGVSGIVGMLGGGWAADRIHRWKPQGRLLLSTVAFLLSAPCFYLALGQPRGAITSVVLLMSLGMTLLFVYYPAVYAAIQDVVEPGSRGTAMALYFFAMYVLGASLGPVGTGMLSDYYAHQAMRAAGASLMTEQFKALGLHNAMYIITWINWLLTAVIFAASRTVAADMQKVAAVNSSA